MKRVCHVLPLALILIGLAAACAVAPAAEVADASAGQSPRGPWVGISMVFDGRALPGSAVRRLLWVVSDKTITMRVGPKVLAETAYKIDASAKPATIDMTFEGKAMQGVYEVGQVELRICLNNPDKGRPGQVPEEPGEGCDADFRFRRAELEWGALHVMDPDGSHPRLLVAHPEYTTVGGSPEWSPDGKQIAFDAWRSILGEDHTAAHVLVCDAAGKGVRHLGLGAMPSWSPDAKRIVFSSYDPYGVWIMNADGTGRELIDGEGWGAQWRPGAEEIAYTVHLSGSANVQVRDLVKKTTRNLLDDRYQTVYWGMAWSPDGQWLAFKGQTAGGDAELAVVHAAGHAKGFRVLLPKAMPDVKEILENVCWSPDSRQVLATLITEGNRGRQLYLINADGQSPGKLLPGQRKGRWYNDKAWSPDGKQILFVSPQESVSPQETQ